MPRAENPFQDGYRSILETSGLCKVSESRIEHGQVVNDRREVALVHRARRHLQCPFVQRSGRSIVAQILLADREVVQAVGHFRVIGPETGLGDGQRAFVDGERVLEIAEV